MNKFLQEWINKIRTKYSNSTLFWTLIFYISYITIAVLCVELAAIISMALSILMVAYVIDDVVYYEDKQNKNRLWFPLSFMFWIVIFVVSIVIVGEWLYKNTIRKFNDWLNSK